MFVRQDRQEVDAAGARCGAQAIIRDLRHDRPAQLRHAQPLPGGVRRRMRAQCAQYASSFNYHPRTRTFYMYV